MTNISVVELTEMAYNVRLLDSIDCSIIDALIDKHHKDNSKTEEEVINYFTKMLQQK